MTRRRRVLAGLVVALLAGPAGAAEEKKKGGGESYLQLPTITATLLRPGGRGVMTMEAGVDAPDPALHARVLLLQPRLQDAYNAVLAGFAASLAPGSCPTWSCWCSACRPPPTAWSAVPARAS